MVALVLNSCQKLKNYDCPADYPSFDVKTNEDKIFLGDIPALVDCDFIECPLGVVCDYLSRMAGVSISCDKQYYSSPVSLHCGGIACIDALQIVARLSNLELFPVSSGYCIGVPNENDRIIISGHVSGYDAQYLQSALSNCLPGCSCIVSPDGLAIISCSPSSASRVRSALASLVSERKLYRVRLCVVDNWYDCDLLNGEISVTGDIVSSLKDWYWRPGLGGVFRFSFGGSFVKGNVISVHDYTILDGEELSVFRGSVVPVAKHHVSDSGSNTVVGYDNLEVGDKLNLRCLGQKDNTALLIFKHEISRISGYVSDYPIRESNELSSSIKVPFGSVYMLGDYSNDDFRWGFLRWVVGRKKSYLLCSVSML